MSTQARADTTPYARADRWAALERYAPLTGIVALLLFLRGARAVPAPSG